MKFIHENRDTYRYQAVEKHIMTMIGSDVLGLGDKLPSLRSLSTNLSVSISTINQAYTELERKGIIESRPRSGFFVRHESIRLPRTKTPPTPMDEPRPVTRSGLIQTVLESVGRTDIVPLGVVAPGPSLLPLREMARIMSQVVKDNPWREIGRAHV